MTPFEGLSGDLCAAGTQYLLAEHDPTSVADCLRQLMDDEDLAGRIARQGHEWIRANMSLEDSVARYARLYEELATLSRH